eukprot:6490071-Amphidinium_carterae.1
MSAKGSESGFIQALVLPAPSHTDAMFRPASVFGNCGSCKKWRTTVDMKHHPAPTNSIKTLNLRGKCIASCIVSATASVPMVRPSLACYDHKSVEKALKVWEHSKLQLPL